MYTWSVLGRQIHGGGQWASTEKEEGWWEAVAHRKLLTWVGKHSQLSALPCDTATPRELCTSGEACESQLNKATIKQKRTHCAPSEHLAGAEIAANLARELQNLNQGRENPRDSMTQHLGPGPC